MSASSRAPASILERLEERIERGLAWLLVLLMVAIVADVTWQVLSRFVFRAPSSFTEELAGFLLIWIGLLGAAYALRTRAHLGIDLLTAKLSGATKRAAAMVAHTLVLLFALTTMVFQLEQISSVMGLRMGYVYVAIPLAGLLMVVFSLGSIAAIATRRAEL
jgi:TRAP-type C4-dicarboxylate transport system permease small subunit